MSSLPHSFRVGDKVRLINIGDRYHGLLACSYYSCYTDVIMNITGVVIALARYDKDLLHVKFDNISNRQGGMFWWRFELAGTLKGNKIIQHKGDK